jgi:hypothetical protein
MKKLLGLMAAVLWLGWGVALADSFDIFEYTPPQGWKKTNLQRG